MVGATIPILEVILAPGETVVATSGELSWISESIQLRTGLQLKSQGIGGLVKRALGGGSVLLTEYRAEGEPGLVAFSAKLPGQIHALEIELGSGYLVHNHGFMCGTEGVEIGVGLQRSLGAGIFAHEGFVLQKVTGEGTAWVEMSGEVVSYELEPGRRLRVHPGHVAAFEETIEMSIVTVPGISNRLFRKEGLYLVSLVGPGRLWLQSLAIPTLAHALLPYVAAPAQRQRVPA